MTKSQIEASSQDIATDLSALRDDITKLSASVADLVRAQAASATSGFMGAMGTAKQKAADTAADAQDKLGTVSADLEGAIEKNPFMALLIALGAGLIMGMLTRPRR